MIIAKESKSKIVIILLLLGICLRISEIDSLFSWQILDKARDLFASIETDFNEYQTYNQEISEHDIIAQELNKEAIHARRSFTSLQNSKRMYNRGFQKNQLFIGTINKYLHSLNETSVFINRTVFQEFRNDLLIVDFIHQTDGKKEDTSYYN